MIWRKVACKQYELFNKVLLMDFRKLSTSGSSVIDHYEVLGLKKTASQAEIKNAYFELSKIYHPDKITPTDESLAKFRAISDAYEILGNEQSRKLYDIGLLKEGGKRETSVADDLSDPIIRFYKERQMRAREIAKPSLDSTDFYEKFKTKTFDRNEYYRYTYVEKDYLDVMPSTNFLLCVTIATAFCIAVHFENTIPHKWYKTFLSWFD